tara:strand:+ start:599 stop:778 length:180 start_codon:yes stop_codon:yes gene_type:complete
MEKKTAAKKKKAMAPGERIKKYSSPGTRKEREAFKGISKAAKMREFKRMGILAPSERGK